MKWACGVTTVAARQDTLLVDTLLSIHRAGFPQPTLFADGYAEPKALRDGLAARSPWLAGIEVTARSKRARIAGNWTLALYELYVKEPHADRFALFQDDILLSASVRPYLERCPYPAKGYWNLILYPSNYNICPKDPAAPDGLKRGWYPSNRLGKGAQALVFSRDAVLTLLSSRYLAERPLDPMRGHLGIDGGVVDAMKLAGWEEWVHHPSLVWHAGKQTTKDKEPRAKMFQEETAGWLGENFDCLSLLPQQTGVEALQETGCKG
jgi:hypothetical protein